MSNPNLAGFHCRKEYQCATHIQGCVLRWEQNHNTYKSGAFLTSYPLVTVGFLYSGLKRNERGGDTTTPTVRFHEGVLSHKGNYFVLAYGETVEAPQSERKPARRQPGTETLPGKPRDQQHSST